MSGENESAAELTPAQIESEASELGWVPKERFRGDPAKWTEAKDFLDYGNKALPALKTVNRRLTREMEEVKAANANYDARLKASEAALKAVSETITETRTVDLKAQEAELTEQIKAARKENDIDLEETLRDERDALRQKINAPVKPAVDNGGNTGQATTVDVMKSAEFKQFQKDNPWFEDDQMMAAAAVAAMANLNKTREAANLTLAQKFAHVETEVKKRFGMAVKPDRSKTEGSRGGADSGGGDGTGKTYADLPSDAKTACDDQGKRFVGAGKKFKTSAEWRSAYCAKYFD